MKLKGGLITNGKPNYIDETQWRLLLSEEDWTSSDSDVDYDLLKEKKQRRKSLDQKPKALPSVHHGHHVSTSGGLIVGVQGLIILVLVGVNIWLGILYSKTTKHETCLTADCVRASFLIESNLNRSIPPCEDFYEYVCSSWPKQHFHNQDGAERWSWFMELDERTLLRNRELLTNQEVKTNFKNSTAIKNMKLFYDSCINTTKLELKGALPLLKLTEELGSWPMKPGKFNEVTWNLQEAQERIIQYGITGLFGVNLMVNPYNNQKYDPAFHTVKTTFWPDVYNSPEAMADFLSFAEIFAKLLNFPTVATKDMFKKFWDLEMELSAIEGSTELTMTTVDELQAKLGNLINITSYLQHIFRDNNFSTKIIQAVSLDYYAKLATIIRNTKKETLANYLVWCVVRQTLGFLSPGFENALQQLYKPVSSSHLSRPQWKKCTLYTQQFLGFAISNLYVDKYIPQTTIDKVSTMVKHLREALEVRIEQSWMDESTKYHAKQKANSLAIHIGYPDWIQDVTKLDLYYKDFQVSGDLFQDRLNFGKALWNKEIDKLSKRVDKHEWDIFPYEVNAYYSLSYNKIVIPLGVLQPPFFDPEFPLSVNFGSLGTLIGHELMHGFDKKGSQHDYLGNKVNWWTNTSAQAFKEKQHCIKDIYSQFSLFGTKLNADVSLNENMADTYGYGIAYNAYKKWLDKEKPKDEVLPGLGFTNNQLFFVGLGQNWCSVSSERLIKIQLKNEHHPPSKLRVNIPLSNSAAFSQAFQCPAGSHMTSTANQCLNIW